MPQTPLIIALVRGLHLAIKVDPHEEPESPVTIALHRGL
jgi:hypothetical protein